jgi:hypothetical protein
VWREYCPSLPLRYRTNPRLIEQPEESRSQTLNHEPSLRGKPIFISYFPFNSLILCIKHVSNLFAPLHLVSKQGLEKQFWRFLVIQSNLEVRSYLPSINFLCRMFTGGNTSAWGKYSRVSRTKWYSRTYDFSQIHQDNHYKRPGAQLITKMKTGQPRSQILTWGRPHVQSRKVCPSKLLFNILFISFE